MVSAQFHALKNKKQFIKEALLKNRYRYHYTILGLPFLLFGKRFSQKIITHVLPMLPSSRLKGRRLYMNKHFSLVTPKDFLTNIRGNRKFLKEL